MKKNLFYLFAFLIGNISFCQNYTTGTINLTTGFTATIDVTNTTVTLTLVGPSTDWMALGFNCTSMGDVGADVVMVAGSPNPTISDRTFNGVGVTPPLDTTQDWTITSNTINSGIRTVIATRARNTGDSQDFVFPLTAQPINIVWGKRAGNLTVGYHGNPGGCGTTVANLTLGLNDFALEAFKIYPNPSSDYLSLELPKEISKGELKIYNQEGKVVVKESVTTQNNKVFISNLSKGTYIAVLRTEEGNITRNLLIN